MVITRPLAHHGALLTTPSHPPHVIRVRGMDPGRRLYCELRWERGAARENMFVSTHLHCQDTLSELDRKISFLKRVMRLFWYWKVLQALLTHLFLPPSPSNRLSSQLFIALIKLCLWKYFSVQAIDNSLSSKCEPHPHSVDLTSVTDLLPPISLLWGADKMWATKRCCIIYNKDVSIVNISRCFQWINEQ